MISQSELAVRIGRSRVTVANLECGKQNVQLHQVFALAEALDVQAGELIPDPSLVKQDVEIALSNAFLELSKSKLQGLIGGSK
jgi:transcriptional regulator with XRE-family HTH domain